MSRTRLGELLIKQGLITEKQMQEAINAQKVQKERIGDVLLKLGMIKEEDLAAALGAQLLIPFVTYMSGLLKPKIAQGLETLVPHEFAQKNIMKAIKDFYLFQGGTENKGGLLDRAVESSYDFDAGNPEPIVTTTSGDTELSIDSLVAKAEEAPVIKLVDLIIRQAIDEKASDIHIEPFKDRIEIRYRIDGVLYQIPPPASHLHLPIVSRIKILSKMDIAEKRLPQDGAISAKLEDRTVDLRVSTLPTVWGEKVVLRILDKGATKLELAHLGFDLKQLTLIRKALESSYGLIFVTGPTGSGKSTTLYSTLNEVFDPTKNIMTAEDPVEFKIEGINQVGVRNDIGLTFAIALKAFLRQDPDIIMVGEVRDLETAQICVRAALTGHLVLSTLHTNDAPSAVTRLVDIGVPHFLLTPSLLLIIAQRLARKLCSKCKEPYEAAGQMVGDYKIKADLLYKAKGCEECNHSGYKGRIVVSEVMALNDEIKRLMALSGAYSDIRDAARKNGMDTMFESGMKKVEEGISSLDEILGIVAD